MPKEKAFKRGSSNVFADLGLQDSQGLLVKAQLVQEIGAMIEQKHLSQVEAARILGVDQPKVSKLLRGHLNEFSNDRLCRFLVALGVNVRIELRKETTKHPARLTVAAVA